MENVGPWKKRKILGSEDPNIIQPIRDFKEERRLKQKTIIGYFGLKNVQVKLEPIALDSIIEHFKVEKNVSINSHEQENEHDNEVSHDLGVVLQSLGEDAAARLKLVQSSERFFGVLSDINNLGGFISWQIAADLLKLMFAKYSENYYFFLGPGAKLGLDRVVTVSSKSESLELTQLLTRCMDKVFQNLNNKFEYFLGRKLTLKTVVHVLCEINNGEQHWLSIVKGNILAPSPQHTTHVHCMPQLRPGAWWVVDGVWRL